MADDTASNRPQPVLYAQLVTVLAAGLGLLSAFGLRLSIEQRGAILAVVSALVPLIAVAGAWWAHRKVTPLSDPRDDQGRRLVAEASLRAGPTEPPGPVIAPPGAPPLPPPLPPAGGRRGRDRRGRWT